MIPRKLITDLLDASSTGAIQVNVMVVGGLYSGALRESEYSDGNHAIYELAMPIPRPDQRGRMQVEVLTLHLSAEAILGIAVVPEEREESPTGLITPQGSTDGSD